MVKLLPTMCETQGQSLGWEDLLEKEMATHFSILAWEIPWMEEHGRLQSGGHKSRTQLYNFTFTLGCYSKVINKKCLSNWTVICKRMKLEQFLTPYKKINSNWIKDLKVRAETIKLLEENISKTLSDINHSKILYDPTSSVTEVRAKINK